MNIMQFQISPTKEKQIQAIKIRILEKFFANSLILSEVEHNLMSVKQNRYSRFTFVENTISNSRGSGFWEKTASFILLT